MDETKTLLRSSAFGAHESEGRLKLTLFHRATCLSNSPDSIAACRRVKSKLTARTMTIPTQRADQVSPNNACWRRRVFKAQAQLATSPSFFTVACGRFETLSTQFGDFLAKVVGRKMLRWTSGYRFKLQSYTEVLRRDVRSQLGALTIYI